MSLLEQMEAARQAVRELKLAAPQIFPEWQELQNAEAALAQARMRVERARKAWDAIGASSQTDGGMR